MQDIMTTVTAPDNSRSITEAAKGDRSGSVQSDEGEHSFRQALDKSRQTASSDNDAAKSPSREAAGGSDLPPDSGDEANVTVSDGVETSSSDAEDVNTAVSTQTILPDATLQSDMPVDPAWQSYFASLAQEQGITSATTAPVETKINTAVRSAAVAPSAVNAELVQQAVNLTPVTGTETEMPKQLTQPAANISNAQAAATVNRNESQLQNTPLQTTAQNNTSDSLMNMQSGSDGDTGQSSSRQSMLNAALLAGVTNTQGRSSADAAPMFSSMINTTGATSTTAGTQMPTLPVMHSAIAEPFGSANWSQGLGRQMMVMVNQNIQTAELRMNPANLGPIEVRIKMDDDQVSVAFSSRHAAVRDAMEVAMPRLREMLEQNGLDLAGSDISQHSFAEQQAQSSYADTDAGRNSGEDGLSTAQSTDSEEQSDTSPVSVMTADDITSMVDFYI